MYITQTDLQNYRTGIDFTAFSTGSLDPLIETAQDLVTDITNRTFGEGTFLERGKCAYRRDGTIILPVNHFKAFKDSSSTVDSLVLYREPTQTPVTIDLSIVPHRIFGQWVEIFNQVKHSNTTFDLTFTVANTPVPSIIKYAIALIVSNMLLANQQSSSSGGSSGATTTLANLVTGFRSGKYSETRKDTSSQSSDTIDLFVTQEIRNMLGKYTILSNDISVC